MPTVNWNNITLYADFDMTDEEAKEYFEDTQADYAIDFAKENIEEL